ncbi:MAG: penicillin-binding transpeptidase domain-containing protein [Chordicoccus sp.]
MDKRLRRKNRFRHFHLNRPLVLVIFCIILSGVLINRLYHLQIIKGESYRTSFAITTTKTRTIKSTRGNIYDRNGNVLASNQLSYSLTIEDSGTYDSTRQQDLELNGEAYRIDQILQANGDSLSNDFHIVLDSNGNYSFDVTGRTLSRFKADVYGEAKIDDLTDAQLNATADEMMDFLTSQKKFGLTRTSKPFTQEELDSVGLPATLTKQQTLDIVYVRYELSTTSYRKYVPVTIATALSDNSVAALNEQKDNLEGIDIVQDTIRVYSDPEAFASIIGYTGKVSSSQLSELQAEDSSYTSDSIVGKSGIEKICESVLKGSDGQQTVYVDKLGKVLEVDDSKTIQPVAGNDVYLTIDKDLQDATYQILEQRIAGILENVIIDDPTYDPSTITDTENIRIPIGDVYNAIIENSVLDISHFASTDASATEQKIQSSFDTKQASVFAAIEAELTRNDPVAYDKLTDEMQEYESYIVNDFLMSDTGILDSSKIDKTDATYLAWTRDETISLQEYLTYAASQNWIDVSAITSSDSSSSSGDTYMDSSEIYSALSNYIIKNLQEDEDFSKLLYKWMIKNGDLTGTEVINAMYDQGVFSKDDEDYSKFESGAMSGIDLIKDKIDKLELTPAQLALDPCSGSAVITDPNTGEILACVSYPGYDNNRLANTMDVAYYNKLAADESQPFYNKATQQTTAPGSTFKLVTTTAGLEEGAITTSTTFTCNGVFDLVSPSLSCWYKPGHGTLNVVGGLANSCNVFFANVAYQLGLNEEGTFSDSLSLGKLQKYAELYNLDKPSGIEVPEATSKVSDQYAIQTAIGQGTNSYTTTQLARYVTTLANSGTSYNISLLDKATDSSGNVVKNYTPSVESTLSISSTTWDAIHEGMRAVIENKPEYQDLGIDVAGKTGTAQESKSRPSHALFICYAPYENPQIAMAVRIGNGYTSTNATLVAKDILQYYFNLTDSSNILTGKAMTESVSSENVD